FHLQCLTPPLISVPDGNWYCDSCIVSTGNEFGFEEGKEHTLSSFQRRADGFKKNWLETHSIPPQKQTSTSSIVKNEDNISLETKKDDAENNGNDENDDRISSPWLTQAFKDELILEDFIEREFWRLVESQSETVEIEYGADIHSATYGSGFPNLEKHPFEPYSRDGWNLNNLPIAPGSLLRFIKSDVAGMTQPWIYVGMVFSTFAWHKEDHYTYSINYHHWGDTKTWYGVPGEDDEKLEEAMKTAAPELFEQQPDLMYQLVTLISPGRLKRAGVRTYVCDQRPNEFVVTCPRSYHSGFNHGFNLNEAVNFCLPDWLPEGNLCIKHYKALQKMPVFSHDELLVTIFHNEKSPRVSRWLLPHFREMVERELADRQKALEQISNLLPDVVIQPNDLPEDQVQCYHCKSFAFLSQVTSPTSSKVSCLDHSHIFASDEKVLRYKYSDDDLQAMLQRVNSRSIKAGRIVDMTGIEQRTSGRKRKPSAALLEAARAALPLAQKIKLAHSSSSLTRQVSSEGLARVYTESVVANESSIDCDEDEKMEVASVASDLAIKSSTKLDEEEVIDDSSDTDGKLPLILSDSQTSNTLARSSLPTVPALSVISHPRSIGKPQTVKTCRNVLLNDKLGSKIEAQFSSGLRGNDSQTISSTLNSRLPDELNNVGNSDLSKPVGRSFKDTDDMMTLYKSSTLREEVLGSTTSYVAPVIAQIDIGGSASIVQLSPSRNPIRSTLNSGQSGSTFKSSQPRPSLESRKRKSKKVNNLSRNQSGEISSQNSPLRPNTSTGDRAGPNVIRIKSSSRSASQPLDVKQTMKQTPEGGLTPPIKFNYSEEDPVVVGSLPQSRFLCPDLTQRHEDNMGEAIKELYSPSPGPMLCHPRGSTPSSLLNILNPIGVDSSHRPFDRNPSPPRRLQPHESIASSHHIYPNRSPSHHERLPHSHSSSLSQSQFPSYHARPQSPTGVGRFGSGCSPSQTHQSPQHSHLLSHLQHPSPHFQPGHLPFPQPSSQSTLQPSLHRRSSSTSYLPSSLHLDQQEKNCPSHNLNTRLYIDNLSSSSTLTTGNKHDLPNPINSNDSYWKTDLNNRPDSSSSSSWWDEEESPLHSS
ncbi:hypothetical protein O181_073866, partial [Austropuccinia psidii MF-1]|nr:hypothetical protein [Austropuccinia psidii MF-1]